MRLKHRSNVDLPHPDGPIKAVTTLLRMTNEIFFNACDLP